MNRRLATLAITALALGTGCSDDTDILDGAVERGSETLTGEEFVAQANAICAVGNAQIESIVGETFGSATIG